jgi:hypothetical protein
MRVPPTSFGALALRAGVVSTDELREAWSLSQDGAGSVAQILERECGLSAEVVGMIAEARRHALERCQACGGTPQLWRRRPLESCRCAQPRRRAIPQPKPMNTGLGCVA